MTEDRPVRGPRFKSPVAEHPGFITFVSPFLGRHYKAWLRASREDLKDQDELEELPAFAEWRGALAILDQVELEGINRSELMADRLSDEIPMVVQVWIRGAAARYLAEHFDLKNLLEPSKTT